MGQSVNAILCFGIHIGSESDPGAWLSDSAYDDLDDLICVEAGVDPNWYSIEDKDEGHAAYLKKKAAIEACPVEIIHHCSGEYPLYILAVRGTEISAGWGDPLDFGDSLPDSPSLEQVKAFKAWVLEHGVTGEDRATWEDVPITDPKPGWILCSYQG